MKTNKLMLRMVADEEANGLDVCWVNWAYNDGPENEEDAENLCGDDDTQEELIRYAKHLIGKNEGINWDDVEVEVKY